MKGAVAGIGVDASWRTPGCAAVGAAREHDVALVSSIASGAEGINVASGLIRRTINGNPRLSKESTGIRRSVGQLISAQVHGDGEIKGERRQTVGGSGRAVHPELTAIVAQKIKLAVRAAVECAKVS